MRLSTFCGLRRDQEQIGLYCYQKFYADSRSEGLLQENYKETKLDPKNYFCGTWDFLEKQLWGFFFRALFLKFFFRSESA
jgi:hypothetical protein